MTMGCKCMECLVELKWEVKKKTYTQVSELKLILYNRCALIHVNSGLLRRNGVHIIIVQVYIAIHALASYPGQRRERAAWYMYLHVLYAHAYTIPYIYRKIVCFMYASHVAKLIAYTALSTYNLL